MKFAVTAGYDQSHAAIAMCEMLKRSGHRIRGVLVVTPYSLRRIKTKWRQLGFHGIKAALAQRVGRESSHVSTDAVLQFLVDNDIRERSLKDWCRKNDAVHCRVATLNGGSAISRLRSWAIDAVIYCGGGILRSEFIAAAKHAVINQHCGPLPEIRGMNAIEWAILLGYEPEITIHLIDDGIDTGEILCRKRVAFTTADSVGTIRSKAVATGIKTTVELTSNIESTSDLRRVPNDGVLAGRQCFVMAPAVRELLELKLRKSA